MRFREIDENEQKKLVRKFVNKLITSLDASYIDITKAKNIEDETFKWLGNSAAFTYLLSDIYKEIICNYKRYTPFCYASIRTAFKNIEDRKQ